MLGLMQAGGIGFASASVLLFAFARRDVGLGERLLLQESLGESQLGGVTSLAYYILRVTFILEAAGFVLLSLRFVPQYGLGRGLWFSLFHSVSAFCNAGYDLFGSVDHPFAGLASYRSDVYVNLVLSSLVIFGGLSFPVLAELASYRRTRRLSMFAKLILTVNLALLTVGATSYAAIEWSNPRTIGPLPVWNKLMAAVFNTAALRTVGMATAAPSGLVTSTQIISMASMLIGASSESTGGGIKTNTFGVLMAAVWDTLRGRQKIQVFGRRLPPETVYKAMTVTVVAMLAISVVSLSLSFSEGGPFKPLLWETISAFGTVGLSLDLTPRLSTPGMLLIMLTMYWGRVGSLTLVTALVQREEPEPISYPVERIPIG